MTYVDPNPPFLAPAPAPAPKGGRPQIEVPDALIRQLQHSDATGARCEIVLTEQDSHEDIRELRRLLARVRSRGMFPGKTIRISKTSTLFAYWVEEKNGGNNK